MKIDATKSSQASPVGLRRVLTLGPLVFYGLSAIIGAGIYVAIGTVISRAGAGAPLSFLIAGIAAAATGLCYAELSSRFPEAAGTVAYVKNAFRSDHLARLAGAALSLAVAASAASIARGAIEYLNVLLPLPGPILITLLIVGFTTIAATGVRESVGLAAAIGLLEIVGLVLAIAAGFMQGPSIDPRIWIPSSYAGLQGVMAGAFIAFFAFIGFETLANMAEEVRNPRRTVPRAIISAIAISIVLYVLVATAAATNDAAAGHPLIGLFEGSSTSIFATIGFLAIANGVLVEIIMLSRLFYGMARRAQLPPLFAKVHPRSRAPLPATILSGVIVLSIALLIPFDLLLVLANAFTLIVFLLVDIALWALQRRNSESDDVFRVPRWLPPVAAMTVVVLVASNFL